MTPGPKLLLSALSLFATPLWPQAGSVWTVDEALGPGADFAELQPAVDAAADGDLVLVRSGTYAPFVLEFGKAVSVLADAGAEVLVVGDAVRLWQTTSPGPILLSGLRVCGNEECADTGSVRGGLNSHDVGGPLWIQDCEFRSAKPAFEALTVSSPTSVVVHTTGVGSLNSIAPSPFEGGRPDGLVVGTFNGGAYVYDCVFRGGPALGGEATASGCKLGSPAGRGAFVLGQRFFSSRTSFEGGSGLDGSDGGEGGALPGMGASGGSGLVVSCAETGLLDSTTSGGAPGAGGSDGVTVCANGEPGLDVEAQGCALDLEVVPTRARHMTSTAVVRETETVDLRFEGLPGELVVLGVSTGAMGIEIDRVSGPLVLAPPVRWLPMGILDAAGHGRAQLAVGELGGAIEFAALFTQPVFAGSGRAVLGTPRATVILDRRL